jgi:hypothetical protein
LFPNSYIIHFFGGGDYIFFHSQYMPKPP